MVFVMRFLRQYILCSGRIGGNKAHLWAHLWFIVLYAGYSVEVIEQGQ